MAFGGILGLQAQPQGLLGGLMPGRSASGGLMGQLLVDGAAPPGTWDGSAPNDPQWALQAYRNKLLLDAIGGTWPAQMAKSAWGAFTLPGDVYAGRVDPLSDEAVQRSADLAGMVTLGAGAIPAEANSIRSGMKVYRGGYRPHDADDLIDRIDRNGAIYFHQDKDVAGEYGFVSEYNVDTSQFFDATTPEGRKIFDKKYKGEAIEAKKDGYSGVIYNDPHDWDYEPSGYEIVVFDPLAIKSSPGVDYWNARSAAEARE